MINKTRISENDQSIPEKEPGITVKTIKGLSKYGVTLFTVIVTAALTWYVNFQLSHLNPVISIVNIDFIYDLEGIKDIIEIPEDLINRDKEGFFGTDLKYFMRFEELQKYSKKDRPPDIAERYDLFEKEIKIFLGLLNKDSINYEIVPYYMMDFLRSNAFNGVASYLVFLEEEGKIKPLIADLTNIEKSKDGQGLIKLTNNLYLLPNMWMRAATTENQKYMAGRIEAFAERMAWNIIKHNDSILIDFLNKGLLVLQQSKESDLMVENGIINLIEDKAKSYKKIKVDFQIINRSEFPILLLQDNELIIKSLKERKKFVIKGVLIDSDKNEIKISPNNLFNSIVLNGKSNLELQFESNEIEEKVLHFIEDLYKEKDLQLMLKIKGKTEKKKQKLFSSTWLIV